MNEESKRSVPLRGLGVASDPAVVAQAAVHLSAAGATVNSSDGGRPRRETATTTIDAEPAPEKREIACPLCGIDHKLGCYVVQAF